MILLRITKILCKTHSYSIVPVFTYGYNTVKYKKYSTNLKPPWSVMFFGTDDFSVYSLRSLSNELKDGKYINNLEVVTSKKAKNNPVLKYAVNENLLVHDWPIKILTTKFDIGIVVSFGHLIPEGVINDFKYGILNVHASLLPRWRGAAPIIHAIANEDNRTGVTIMRIEPKKFDIGDILMQESVNIPKDITMPVLYHLLGKLGAETLLKTLYNLKNCLKEAKQQTSIGITYAPKVTSDMAIVNFNKLSSQKIIALSRALYTLYPLTTIWNNIPIKLLEIDLNPVLVDIVTNKIDESPGFVMFDKKLNTLLILCSDKKFISVKKVGLSGKKPMTAKDFNNGYIKKENLQRRFFR